MNQKKLTADEFTNAILSVHGPRSAVDYVEQHIRDLGRTEAAMKARKEEYEAALQIIQVRYPKTG